MRRGAPVLLALVAVAAVLGPMIAIGFVNDDYTIIRFALHGARPDLGALLTRAEVIEVYYRPLFDLSLVLDFLVHGWNAAGFRSTNLALHLINSLLVWALARRLRFDDTTAIVALLLFGLHPIHETSIYWIAGRTDILCTAFYLAALLLVAGHIESRRAGPLVSALALCLAAILTKEMALTLPLVVAAVVLWMRRQEPLRTRLRSALSIAWPFAAVIAATLVLRYIMLENDLFGARGVHQDVGVLQIVRNVGTYLGLLVIPTGHGAIEETLRGNPLLFVALAAGSLLVATVVLVRWRRTLAPLLFCSAAMLLTMLPVLRLMMRWYLYLPSVFFAIGLGWLLSRALLLKRGLAFAATAIILLAYAAIDLVAIDAWVDAGRLAEGLGAQLRSVALDARAGDTLRFATVPGKLGAAPVFNLGFAGTVRHVLGEDSLAVLYASRLTMRGYPSHISHDLDSASGELLIEAAGGEYFTVSAAEIVSQRAVADAGAVFDSELGPLRILDASTPGRPTRMSIALAPAEARTKTYLFDGVRFRLVLTGSGAH